jgi:Na+:H+ antiporter, NhaA family
LWMAGAGIATLCLLSWLRVRHVAVYLLVGAAIWLAVLKSGVHATLAGVVVALFIPTDAQAEERESPLHALEHALQPWVMYGIVPVFAFANAGVALTGLAWDAFPAGVALGIAVGLLVGKIVGIFGASWLAVKLGVSSLPQGIDWRSVFGMALLCGIGFTMSLFIGTLAFEHQGVAFSAAVRIGVLGGSVVSAVAGYLFLRRVWDASRAK